MVIRQSRAVASAGIALTVAIGTPIGASLPAHESAHELPIPITDILHSPELLEEVRVVDPVDVEALHEAVVSGEELPLDIEVGETVMFYSDEGVTIVRSTPGVGRARNSPPCNESSSVGTPWRTTNGRYMRGSAQLSRSIGCGAEIHLSAFLYRVNWAGNRVFVPGSRGPVHVVRGGQAASSVAQATCQNNNQTTWWTRARFYEPRRPPQSGDERIPFGGSIRQGCGV